MLRINGDKIAKKELIVIDKSTQKITHFFGTREVYKDLSENIDNH